MKIPDYVGLPIAADEHEATALDALSAAQNYRPHESEANGGYGTRER
jgi:hypothetical protein